MTELRTGQIRLVLLEIIKATLGEQILSEQQEVATVLLTALIPSVQQGIIKVILGAQILLVLLEVATEQLVVQIHLAQCAVTKYITSKGSIALRAGHANARRCFGRYAQIIRSHR